MAEKIQTGLRVPVEQYTKLFSMAEHMGVSLNALMLVLLDIGLSVFSLGTEAEFHSLLRNLRDISEQQIQSNC